LPLLNPYLDVGLGLFELAAIAKPAQFLQAIVIARSPRQANEVGGEGVASIPLVDLSADAAATM
jgi:hypothetical protein